MDEKEYLQPNLDEEESEPPYGHKETELIFDHTSHHDLPHHTGLTTSSQEENKLSGGQQETEAPFVSSDVQSSSPESVSELSGTVLPIQESNSELRFVYSGETQEAIRLSAVTSLPDESLSTTESTTAEHRHDTGYIRLQDNHFENCTINFNGSSVSSPEPSCQLDPTDPSITCSFSELFDDCIREIITLLKDSKLDKFVLLRAINLTASNPEAKVYPEAKDAKDLEELFFECAKRNRWNWMDFDALRFLLSKWKEALNILDKYRQKFHKHLDCRMRILKEAPPHDERHILDVKDRCDDMQMKLRDIIKHKNAVAKSLNIGMEVFTLLDVYKGCVVFRYVIHSDIISKIVRETLLRKGGQEGNIHGRSTVTLNLQSDGCVCTHDAIPEHYDKDEVKIRDEVTAIATAMYRRYGAECIETSQISYRRNLKGKYLEESTESEVICSLTADDDEETAGQLSLRPDLTVPFARYLAWKEITQLKRYEFGKVFSKQRDTMGQCMKEEFVIDYDIAGECDVMASDAECVRLVYKVLNAVEVEDFIIRVNHVKLLEGILSQSGIKGDIQRVMHYLANCDDACQCLVANGQPREVAEKVAEYLKLKGDSRRVIDSLRGDGKLKSNLLIQDGLDEMSALLHYCRAFGVIDKVHIDLGLFRAYKYYTGMMFQAFVTDGRLGLSLIHI